MSFLFDFFNILIVCLLSLLIDEQLQELPARSFAKTKQTTFNNVNQQAALPRNDVPVVRLFEHYKVPFVTCVIHFRAKTQVLCVKSTL